MNDKTVSDWDWSGDESRVFAFRENLKQWGKQNFRAFPWRRTTDPYLILIAEVMLHRTQVKQVVPVYESFASLYPDLRHFLRTGRTELKFILQPLGLNWRIDLIYEMSQALSDQFGEQIPVEKADLLSLPGVSEYIACAVRCFAWNLPEPLIDTNTVRIIGRVSGWEVKDSSRRNKRFRDALATLVDIDDPRSYNYGLLDLAHQLCLKKQAPLCNKCPLILLCHHGLSIQTP